MWCFFPKRFSRRKLFNLFWLSLKRSENPNPVNIRIINIRMS